MAANPWNFVVSTFIKHHLYSLKEHFESSLKLYLNLRLSSAHRRAVQVLCQCRLGWSRADVAAARLLCAMLLHPAKKRGVTSVSVCRVYMSVAIISNLWTCPSFLVVYISSEFCLNIYRFSQSPHKVRSTLWWTLFNAIARKYPPTKLRSIQPVVNCTLYSMKRMICGTGK